MRIKLGSGDNTLAEETETTNRMVADTPIAVLTPPPVPEPLPAPVAIQGAPDGGAFDPLAFWEEFFNREFPEAVATFSKILKTNPEDQPARLFMNKSGEHMLKEVPDDWTGVEVMTFK